MTRQLGLYQNVVPVSLASHATACVEPVGNHAYSAETQSVPLLPAEFAAAGAEYPLVFSTDGDGSTPIALLGWRAAQNLFVAPDGHWQGGYVPAFIRAYPFALGTADQGKTLTLSVDESFAGLNRQGRGNALFGADGKPSEYLDRVLAFMKDFQRGIERGRAFARQIAALGLLEPMQASITTPAGESMLLNGFQVVNRDRLRALDAATLHALAANDALEMIYLHLASLRNFERLKTRLAVADSRSPR